MKKLFSMLLLVCIVIPLQIQAISMEAIKNDKNYVVFKKINGKTKEIVNQKIYQTYNHDLNQGSLKKKKLSVVIILSKDQSQKSYVFKLNFSKENGGLYE